MFWNGEVGIKKIITVALPIVVNTSAFTIMTFVDRKFLLHHSLSEFAASVPASMLAFALIAFFVGTISFIATLVSQSCGAKSERGAGAAVWSGVYLALIAYVCLLPILYFAPDIFRLFGHDESLIPFEARYLRVLHVGAIFQLMINVFQAFFSGIGKTRIVMILGLLMSLINVPLDYLLIFGFGGIPSLGILGAGIATITSQAIVMLSYMGIAFHRQYRIPYYLFDFHFNKTEFFRLLKYGIPSGVSVVLVNAGFAIFMMMAGLIGEQTLAASNAAFSMDGLVFMPIFGTHVGVVVIAGQLIGAKRYELIPRLLFNSVFTILCFVAPVSLLFVLAPEVSLAPLLSGIEGDDYQTIFSLAKVYMIFVAVYSWFDALGMMTKAILVAAGDTSYLMKASIVTCLMIFILPAFLVAAVFNLSGNYLWLTSTTFIAVNFFVFFSRYKRGSWREIRVLE